MGSEKRNVSGVSIVDVLWLLAITVFFLGCGLAVRLIHQLGSEG